MPYSPVDPSTLEGDDLDRWYQRTPEEIEQERQAAAQQRYDDFFYSPSEQSSAELLTLVGNPHNRRLKREHIREYGDWPVDENGRPYDVAHYKAIADGGTNTLDNIRPLQRDEHIAEHKAAGDFGRWGKRAATARAFGGRVGEMLGPVAIVPDITGIISGRIRTDTPDNFLHDMFNLPSMEDRRKAYEQYQKALNPTWKWGDPEGV